VIINFCCLEQQTSHEQTLLSFVVFLLCALLHVIMDIYVCDHVRASVSGLFKDPSCPVNFCPLKSSFIRSFIPVLSLFPVTSGELQHKDCFVMREMYMYCALLIICVLYVHLQTFCTVMLLY